MLTKKPLPATDPTQVAQFARMLQMWARKDHGTDDVRDARVADYYRSVLRFNLATVRTWLPRYEAGARHSRMFVHGSLVAAKAARALLTQRPVTGTEVV